MTTNLGASLEIVAPYYNIVLVIIVLILFAKFFSLKNKNVYMKPWKLLFFVIMVYIIEEFINILQNIYSFEISVLLFPIFEMIMIILFIYMLLLQKEYITKNKLK